MTYVYLNYNQMKSVVGELTNYADTIEQTRAEIQRTREDNNGVGDTSGMANWGELVASLRDNSTEINDRIETAKKLNENGLSPMKGELISYIVPDDMEDKKDTVVMHAKGAVDATKLSSRVEENEQSLDPPNEASNELVSQIEKNKNNEIYARAFVSTLGPEKMLDLPHRMMRSLGYKPGIFRGNSVPRNPQSMHSLDNSFAHMLSIASRKWGDRKAADFANKLADAAKSDPNRMRSLNAILYTRPESENKKDKARTLKYHDAMLLTLAKRLEKFNDPAPHDEPPCDDPKSPYYDPTYPKDSGYSTSPLFGIVRALSSNPKLAQEWLLPPSSLKDPEPLDSASAMNAINRIRGLVGRCNFTRKGWAEDWAIIADEIGQGKGSDAKIVPHSYADTRTAATVSGIMNGLGDNLTPEIIKNHLTDEMKSRSGDVLSRYPAGIDYSTAPIHDESDESFLESDESDPRSQPVLGKNAMRNLFAVTRDHSKLGKSLQEHHEHRITEEQENYHPNRKDKLTSALNNHSRTNGFMIGSHNWYNIQIEKNNDKSEEAAREVASWAVGSIPVVGGPLSKVHDQMVKHIVAEQQSSLEKKALELRDLGKDLSKDRATLSLLRSRGKSLAPEELEELRKNHLIKNHLFNGDKLELSPEKLENGDVNAVDQALSLVANKLNVAPGDKDKLDTVLDRAFNEGYDAVGNIP